MHWGSVMTPISVLNPSSAVPPASVIFAYFLAISWRHTYSVCRHKVANGGYLEDETTAPKKHLPIQKRSHVAHLFPRQI